MVVNCQRCGTQVAANEWFCSFCGKERPMCPDCGAEMDDEKCKNCETPRQAPCGNCGLMINATDKECPNCGYNENQQVQEKSSGRKKKALALAGIGVVGFFLVSSIIPSPNIIGQAVGALLALPFISWGGMIGFYYGRKESKAENRNAADLSKGREQNKTKEWREMEQEQRKAMLNAAAEGLSAAGKYAEKKKKDKQVEELSNQLDETVEYAAQKEEEAVEAKKEKQKLKESPDLPSKCPRCGTSWSGGLLGSGNVERFSNGRKASCTKCPHTELLFRE